MNTSPIEIKFMEAAKKAWLFFEREKFVNRYRVDFIDESRKLIIELDWHDSHKSKEDRTYDASRDRQLLVSWYTVIRFTWTEIYKNADKCVDEILQILRAIEPQPKISWAIYIDYAFLDESYIKCRWRYKKDLKLSEFLKFLVNYLHLNWNWDVHLFWRASTFSKSIIDIDTFRYLDINSTCLRIHEYQPEFTAITLLEHLFKEWTIYDNIVLVADDWAYPPPLYQRWKRIDVLIRKSNNETSMWLIETKWQDIDYIIWWSLGLETQEL